MAKKFETLRARMSPESQARSKERTAQLLREMPLHELRQALGLSQKVLAEILEIQQPSVAKLEKRTDMYISTLRSHVEAMGGQLEVIARFPDGVVKISNFASHSPAQPKVEAEAEDRRKAVEASNAAKVKFLADKAPRDIETPRKHHALRDWLKEGHLA